MSDPYRVQMRFCCDRSVEQEHAPNCPVRYRVNVAPPSWEGRHHMRDYWTPDYVFSVPSILRRCA